MGERVEVPTSADGIEPERLLISLPQINEVYLLSILYLFQKPQGMTQVYGQVKYAMELVYGSDESARFINEKAFLEAFAGLKSAGFVTSQRHGRHNSYTLRPEFANDLALQALGLLAVAKRKQFSLRALFGNNGPKKLMLFHALAAEYPDWQSHFDLIDQSGFTLTNTQQIIEQLTREGITTQQTVRGQRRQGVGGVEVKLSEQNNESIIQIVRATRASFITTSADRLFTIAARLGLSVKRETGETKEALLVKIVGGLFKRNDVVGLLGRLYVGKEQNTLATNARKLIYDAYISGRELTSEDMPRLLGHREPTTDTFLDLGEIFMGEKRGRQVYFTLNPKIQLALDEIRLYIQQRLTADEPIYPELLIKRIPLVSSETARQVIDAFMQKELLGSLEDEEFEDDQEYGGDGENDHS